MPDIQWNLTVGQESVSAAVQRIGQALGGLDSTSTRAAGGLAAALGQTQTAATATAGAVQRLGAQPLRLTDQATPLLTQLRAELNRLAGPPPVVLTARDGITPLLAPLTTRLEHLPAPPAIPITARDDVAAVLQRITGEVQRLNITVPPIRIPAVAAPAPPAAQAAAADPAGTQRLAQQAAAAQGAVQSLGTRLDTLQRQLAGIGQTRPSITLTSNYQALQAEIATLQSRLTALSKQPYSVQVKTETAQVRADLAGLQRQFAGFKAELPPLAPKVDSGPVESALRRMQQGFQETGRAAQQHSGAVSSFFSNALSAATGFLAANVFSRITSDVLGLGQGMIQAAGDMERTRAGFTSILGSAQAADTLIKQLQTEANISPFELDSFRKAAQLLLGMGVAADDITPRLHEVSNVVAAVGGGTEQFDRISLALGQIQAKGKVQAQEINQLAESGVAGWDMLAKAMGKSQAQVIALSQAGKISAEEFFNAFAQYANSPAIAQAADKQSHTFQGLLSTIHDVGQALEISFGTPVLAAVEPVLEQIVSSLKDPAVVTTLGQWGAAAGQFVVGLINAGQTAFTVASQIIQALQPVTDFLGQLFGISGQAAPTIKPPDFTPAAQSAGTFGANIKSSGDSAKSATDQVKALEAQTRELSRATAEANVGYDHRKQSLQDQLTLLDRQYQAENKAADVQSLQEKIAKDRVLAVNQYSSQGQAAASRLVDEEARLKALQREQGHDALKAGIEDRIKAVDREKQATDEASAARTRALQEQMDALRANAAATTALTNAIAPPRAAGGGPDKSQNRNVNDAFGDNQTAAKATGLIGLLQQVRDALTGDKGLGAAIGAIGDDWKLLLGSFDKTPASVQAMGTAFDHLINTLGGTGGMQGVMIAVNAEVERFIESATVGTPQILSRLGNNFSELADSITQAADAGAILVEVLKLQTGGGSQDALAHAFARLGADQKAAQQRHDAFVAADTAQGATHDSRIDQINKDINARRDAALAAIDQNRVISSTGKQGADFGNGPDFGPGVTTTTTLPHTPQVAPVQHNIRMEFDANGFKRFIDANTGQVLAEALR